MGLPTGPSVTFLFTDIEGSTRLERAVGSDGWAATVARHDALLRAAVEAHAGHVVKTEGDAFFASFADPLDAARGRRRRPAPDRGGRPWPFDVLPRPDGPPPRRGPAAPGPPGGRAGGLRRDRGELRGPDRGGRRTAARSSLSDALAAALEARPDRGRRGLAGVELVDDGLRAVKDFEEPARLHRLVVPGAADDGRRLRTLDAPSNLPGDVTSLVGREAEIRLVGEQLAESRIVTLTGPGGSGKTRLALGAARAVADRFPHGTWFVDLAAAPRPGPRRDRRSPPRSASASPPTSRSAEALRAQLRDQSTLLILDNLEQLLPAAADTVSSLVRASPDLRVLVTSRELLRIGGEQGYPVPPLDAVGGHRAVRGAGPDPPARAGLRRRRRRRDPGDLRAARRPAARDRARRRARPDA